MTYRDTTHLKIRYLYRVFTNYCVFSLNFCDFLNSASSAAALVSYLPGVCTLTDTKGKQGKVRVRNILKSLEKNTIFNEHPVPPRICFASKKKYTVGI